MIDTSNKNGTSDDTSSRPISCDGSQYFQASSAAQAGRCARRPKANYSRRYPRTRAPRLYSPPVRPRQFTYCRLFGSGPRTFICRRTKKPPGSGQLLLRPQPGTFRTRTAAYAFLSLRSLIDRGLRGRHSPGQIPFQHKPSINHRFIGHMGNPLQPSGCLLRKRRTGRSPTGALGVLLRTRNHPERQINLDTKTRSLRSLWAVI